MPTDSGQTESDAAAQGSAAADDLARRYHAVRQRIADAARRAGRDPQGVHLVAVTKYASIDEIRRLIELGHADFGENRVQQLIQRAAQADEFLARHRQLRTDKPVELPQRIRWHMIGHLQRNKVRKLLGLVRLIHSVDSLRLAEEIQAAGARLDEPVEVLIQINVAGEKQKHGVLPAAARHLLEQMDTMLNLKPRGMMVMAPYSENPEDARPVFTRARELFEDIHRVGAVDDQFNILSMGMTSDFEVAVECGANVVRVGSAIFGSEVSTDDEPADDSDDADE